MSKFSNSLPGEFKSAADFTYQTLRCNVDLLKLIQVGFTFFDDKGNTIDDDTGITTWQFNFQFSVTEDMYAEKSVQLLKNSGIQFDRHDQVNANLWQTSLVQMVLELVQ